MKGDISNVRILLQQNPDLLQERNILGQTPFHLAVTDSKMLEALMASDDAMLIDEKDYRHEGNYVTDYATKHSGNVCSNGTSWEACSDCPCLEPFNFLQTHGFRYSLEGFLQRNFANASHSCRLAMVARLKRSRDQLKYIARRHLSSEEIRHYELNVPKVLDYWAAEVVDRLEEEGTPIPAKLRTELDMSVMRSHQAVYHCLSEANDRSADRIAELLHEHGFLDIDYSCSKGETPLIACALKYFGHTEYMLWLVKHGADKLRHLPAWGPDYGRRNNVHLTAAHAVLQHWPMGIMSGESSTGLQLASMMAPMEVYDQCRCGCVEKGCPPSKALFSEMWRTSRKYSKACPFRNTAVGLFIEFRVTHLDISQWEHACISALRLFTFGALGLRHTCCEIPFELHHSPEEVVEIQDVDSEGLDLLEKLMGEFTEEYRRRGVNFADFLVSFWAARMDKVLADLEAVRLTEKQRRNAESLGVKWEEEKVEEEKEVEKEDKTSLEYWRRRFDEVAPL